MKESDALYVKNFEATCFLNQEEPEDYEHWEPKESRLLPNGKGTKNAGRGQFDALSQGLQICDESKETDTTLFGLDHFPKYVPLNVSCFDVIRCSGRKMIP